MQGKITNPPKSQCIPVITNRSKGVRKGGDDDEIKIAYKEDNGLVGK